MVALSIETVLLMAAAYFLGAALACIVRRSLFRAEPVAVAERRVEPLPEIAARDPDAARFAPRLAAPQPAPAPARAAAPPPAAPATQDLQNIQGIDARTAASLERLGITRYEQIAAWMKADVDRFGLALWGERGRISRENWIEQAQVLAKGATTLYATRRAAGEASTAAPTPDEGERGPPTPAAPLPRPMSRVGVSAAVVTPSPGPGSTSAPAAVAPPLVSDRAAFANRETGPGAAAETGAAVPIRPTEPSHHDNLCRIGGITPEIEEKLNALGVSRYSEIAQWSPAAVERIDRELGTAGRIAHENWIEQAQILSRGGDTRFSREYDIRARGEGPRPVKLPDAIREHEAAVAAGQAPGTAPARTDLGALRSVRSKAYQDTSEPGPEAARRVAARSRVVRTAEADDLKRIRGIGVTTEKRLNALGVTTYEEIANWTREDIDRVSQQLAFKGSIERENWVEQARILSSGGDTEFSRRLDRREPETSRLKT
jgi:predicted flap endonuclease-1-like 5' DNA nuclease